jgi:hypothetical protein
MIDWKNKKLDNWCQSGEGGKNRWISEDERKFKKFEAEDSSYGIGSTSME